MRKPLNLFAKLGLSLLLSATMAQNAEAQLGYGIYAIGQGAKAAKGNKANKKYEPLKEKALNAIEKNDIEYLMSEECTQQLAEFGEKLTGKNAQDWTLTKAKIDTYFYVLCHTLEKDNFLANIDDLMGKAAKATSEKEKALYVDAAIAVMKGMIVYNYDVNANLQAVNSAYSKVKAMYDQLPASYKPVTVPKGANTRDVRFLHNLTGGVPNAQDMIEIQGQLAQQRQAEEAAKAKAEAEKAEKEAQDLENRKKMFYEMGNDNCIVTIKRKHKYSETSTYLEDYNIASAYGNDIFYGVGFKENGYTVESTVSRNRKRLVSFTRRSYEDESKNCIEYRGAFDAYVSPELKVYKGYNSFRDQSAYVGYMDSKGNCYDKYGYKIGSVDYWGIHRGSQEWKFYQGNGNNTTTRINMALTFIFFPQGGEFDLKGE